MTLVSQMGTGEGELPAIRFPAMIAQFFSSTRELRCLPLSLAFGLALLGNSVAAEALRFSFGDEPAEDGVTAVAPDDMYDPDRGFGFLRLRGDGGAAVFAVDLEEGNYDVSLRIGSDSEAGNTAIKAEARRLFFREVATEAGEFEERRFTVNVRQPEFGDGGEVRLKDREEGPPMIASWDRWLTLEFNGEAPKVAEVSIEPNPEAVTVFLAGDSTVTDQRNEPWSGWGQMLPSFFRQGVAVSNHAESGLALFSFEGQRRLQKVLSMMNEGDYLFIQFGHNDQKDRREGAGAFTTYRKDLGTFVEAFRSKGGKPVLVTPMERRRWSGGKPTTTLDDYAAAVRQAGEEMEVPVIDLHRMSLEFYAALGETGSQDAFVFYPAGSWPGQFGELKDNTHHSPYGGYELARCVVEGIRAGLPGLAEHLRDGVGDFDPSKPDAPASVAIPPSPVIGENDTPDGN